MKKVIPIKCASLGKMVAVVAAAFAVFAVSQAQAQSMSDSYRYGFSRSLPGELQSGGEVPILDVSVGGAVNADEILGCSGLNLDALGQSVMQMMDLDQIGDMMMNYVQTNLANYLLTQIYSSPAIAAIFDSLEAFSAARVEMLQARCRADEIRDEYKAERSAAREACLRAAETDADKAECLNDVEKIKDWIERNAEDTAGSLHTILADSNLCGTADGLRGEDGTVPGGDSAINDCPLLMFVPDVAWCASGARDCQTNRSAEAKNSPAETAQKGEQLAMGLAAQDASTVQNIQESLNTYADSMKGTDAVASVNARYALPEMINGTFEGGSGGGDDEAEMPTDDSNPFVADMSLGDLHPTTQEFAKFMNCTDVGSYPSVFRLQYQRVKEGMNSLGLATPTPAQITAGVDLIGAYNQSVMGNGGISDFARNALEENGVDMPADDQLINVAVRCVRNHVFVLDMNDYRNILSSNLKASEKLGLMNAIATQTAFVASEGVLRFVKSKLIETTVMKYSSSESGDKKSGDLAEGQKSGDRYDTLPAGVIDRVKLTIENLDNQIAYLRQQREARGTMADLIGRIEGLRKPLPPRQYNY